MSIAALLRLAGRGMPHSTLVKSWWPKPVIKPLPEKYWGDKWQNVNSGCMHKYRCTSFSAIGFQTKEKNPNGPSQVCLGYGETPEQAYDQWCEVFNVWNNEGDWVR
jgi:hypothetical protein